MNGSSKHLSIGEIESSSDNEDERYDQVMSLEASDRRGPMHLRSTSSLGNGTGNGSITRDSHVQDLETGRTGGYRAHRAVVSM
jgi:hypothetical protein